MTIGNHSVEMTGVDRRSEAPVDRGTPGSPDRLEPATGSPEASPDATSPDATSPDQRVGGSEPVRSRSVHWGAVWAGALVALPVFFVLQMLFLALGWLDLGVSGRGQAATASAVSMVLGAAAFFVGGLLAGSTTRGAGSGAGLLHGVLMWALAIVALFGLGLFGGGVLVGNVGVAAALVTAPEAALIVDVAQSATGWAALWLGVSVAAAALGGLRGASARGGPVVE
ncbi:hypothetical protein ACFPK1_08720 [Actinomycetospora rhizophila]